MIIRNVMIEDVTSVSPKETVQQAYDLIQTKRHDCLPVMDGNHLVGIIQLTDIYEACMKDGRQTTLSKPVSEIMVKNPITIHPDAVIEEAAKIMRDKDIPFLPVVDEGKLVGVISESDLFDAFAELLGVDSGTARLTLVVPDVRGQLARIAEIIRDAGVSITHLATFRTVMDQYKIVVRVETDVTKPLIELLDQHGYKVIHSTH